MHDEEDGTEPSGDSTPAEATAPTPAPPSSAPPAPPSEAGFSPLSAPAWPLPPADPAGTPLGFGAGPAPTPTTTQIPPAPTDGNALEPPTVETPPHTLPDGYMGSSPTSGHTFSPLTAPPPASGTSDQGPKPAKRPWIAIAVVAALIGAGVGAGITALTDNNNANGSDNLTIKESNAAPGAAILNGNVTIPQLVKKVIPSVVSIDVKSDGSEDEGTGMIITANGEVVTNNHVIELFTDDGNTGTITVTEYGQTKALPATLVGYDTTHDVALLKINNAANLPTVTFGSSNKAVVGDYVVAIGNALGLAAGTPTVTQGIISALGRSVTASGEGTQAENLTNLMQTDAAINPGNSGGPLIDTAGQVIAMNTAVAGTAEDGTNAQNIGFAIPIAEVESLIPELLKGGAAASGGGYLGVDITTMTASLRQQYGLTPSSGALLLDVVAGSPAANAGLQQGDVIVAIDGTSITSAEQLQTIIQKDKPGQSISVQYYAGSNKQTVSITLGNQSQAAQQEAGSGLP